MTADGPQERLTPVWCPRCGFYVPAEREPHIGIRSNGLPTPLHYAAYDEQEDATPGEPHDE